MKKILLLSAALLGAVTVSQAGVRFSIGIPIPAPPIFVAPPAPVYVQPSEPAYVAPPSVYLAPPVVVAPPVFDFRFGDHRRIYRSVPYRPYYHQDWHRDRDDHRGHDGGHYRR